jgi:hypothetical protein
MHAIDPSGQRAAREAAVARNRAKARTKALDGKRVWQIKCHVSRAKIQSARRSLAEKSAAATDRSKRAKELQRRQVDARRSSHQAAKERAKRASRRATGRARARQRQATS